MTSERQEQHEIEEYQGPVWRWCLCMQRVILLSQPFTKESFCVCVWVVLLYLMSNQPPSLWVNLHKPYCGTKESVVDWHVISPLHTSNAPFLIIHQSYCSEQTTALGKIKLETLHSSCFVFQFWKEPRWNHMKVFGERRHIYESPQYSW